jgi:YidC/Oxa1 family membrane protein insertase
LLLSAARPSWDLDLTPGFLAELDTVAEWDPQKVEKVALEAKKGPVTDPVVKTVELGGEGFYLSAKLTTRGAGVQKLTLTKFQAATWGGKPAFVDGQPKPLDLIPEDPVQPSFLMYHYADPDPPDPNNPRPDTTLGERIWELESNKSEGETSTAIFTTKGPPGYEHLKLRKIYTLHKQDYHIDLKIEIENITSTPATQLKPFRYQLAGAHGLPIEGEWYTSTFRNVAIGVLDKNKALWRTWEDANKISYLKGGTQVPGSKGPDDVVQYAAVTTQFFTSAIAVSDKQAQGVLPQNVLSYARATLESEEYLCYFDGPWDGKTASIRLKDKEGPPLTVILLPRAQDDLKDIKPRSGDQLIINMYSVWQDGEEKFVAEGFRRGTVLKPFLSDITVRVVSGKVVPEPHDSVVHQFVLYHGPIKISQLSYATEVAGQVAPDLVERYANTLHLATLTDYPTVTWLAWWSDLIIFCIKIMHWLLDLLYRIVPIEGLTIILLTVIVRGLMFPISRKQALTAMRMQELAPEMRKLQEKYKNDVQARNQAMMELYRKHNVNPLSGCGPILLQMPIFLGLYFALQESIRFRLAPFLWIENLAAPDMLIYWTQNIPLISDPDNQPGGSKSFLGGIASWFYLGPYFNILPVVAVTLMLVSQKMMMPPAQDEQQAAQQKMMTYMMVFFGLMFYKVAAGLCIYFIATTLWGLAERRFLPKKKSGAPPPAETAPTKPGQPKDTSKLTPAQRRKQRAKGKKQDQPDSAMKKVRNWWEEVLKQAKKK